MTEVTSRTAVQCGALVVFVLWATICSGVKAQATQVDPAATEILKKMTDYLGSLKQFSVHTQNTLEDVLDSGHRIDLDVSAQVILSRPNKLRSERKGDLVNQVFYYDGKTMTLYNPSNNVYATESVPETYEGLFAYLYEMHGIGIPISDLVYSNSFPLLMQDVTFATVVGKTYINNIQCNHLLFSRPGVDFQGWVTDGGTPLPLKYVVTDTSLSGLLSITTVMSDWNVKPAADDSQFIFVPPKEAQAINFMPF